MKLLTDMKDMEGKAIDKVCHDSFDRCLSLSFNDGTAIVLQANSCCDEHTIDIKSPAEDEKIFYMYQIGLIKKDYYEKRVEEREEMVRISELKHLARLKAKYPRA